MKKIIAEEIFYILTFALLIFGGLEIIWPRIILAYININWVLIFWLIVGIIILILNKTDNVESNANKR